MSMESNILGEKGKNGITDCHNFEMAEDGHLYSPPAPAMTKIQLKTTKVAYQQIHISSAQA